MPAGVPLACWPRLLAHAWSNMRCYAVVQALELSRAQQDLLLAEKASVKLQAERDDLGKKVGLTAATTALHHNSNMPRPLASNHVTPMSTPLTPYCVHSMPSR